jgi:hypothetical protein
MEADSHDAALARARELLAPPVRSSGTGPALAAAAFLAITALALATTVILLPLTAPLGPKARPTIGAT